MAKIFVFNPLNEDFSVKYDINNDGKPVTFTVKSKEVAEFKSRIIADHVRKHLANRIFDAEYSYKKDRETQMKEIYKRMRMKA